MYKHKLEEKKKKREASIAAKQVSFPFQRHNPIIIIDFFTNESSIQGSVYEYDES